MGSACVYIECPVTRMILGVSRKDDPNAWGLPGGKIEEGQTEEEAALAEAALAELAQETGVVLYKRLLNGESSLREIFRREGGVTFQAALSSVFSVGRRAPGETGRVAWVTLKQLMDGPFGDYNRRLLQTIGRVPADAVPTEEEKCLCKYGPFACGIHQ